MSRSRRSAGSSEPVSMASVSRGPPSSPSQTPSMRLTVKLSSNKLRDATAGAKGGSDAATSRSSGVKDPFIGGQIIEGKRARNVRKSYIVESESDEDDEVEEEEEEEDSLMVDDESPNEDTFAGKRGGGDSYSERSEEDEDADADGDIDMDILPPPPVIKVSKAPQTGKPVIAVKPPPKAAPLVSVETKEIQATAVQAGSDDDDEELSDLEMDSEVEEGLDSNAGADEDAEGEDEDEVAGDGEGDEDEEDEDEEQTQNPAEAEDEYDWDSEEKEALPGLSRGSTPDVSKLTKRQRARLEEGGSGHLLALPDEVQVKKHFTAEEHAMRRAEMARRRKNLSEKRNEEEKMETINKLLKKQAPKTNLRRNLLAGTNDNAAGEGGEPQKPDAVFVRWVSGKEGNKIGVPDEWLAGPVGAMFLNKPSLIGNGIDGGRLVGEVE